MAGRATNSSSGSDAAAKRRAPSSIGLRSCSPSFMATKLRPQIRTTPIAAARSPRLSVVFMGRPPSCALRCELAWGGPAPRSRRHATGWRPLRAAGGLECHERLQAGLLRHIAEFGLEPLVAQHRAIAQEVELLGTVAADAEPRANGQRELEQRCRHRQQRLAQTLRDLRER